MQSLPLRSEYDLAYEKASDRICEETFEAAYEKARLCAHRVLRAREKTSYELQKRLIEKGHDKDAAEKVVARFVEVGLLDDKRYTEAYIRTAQNACKGWRRIMEELRRKGIATEYLTPPPDACELERAKTTIERLQIETRKDHERAMRKLLNRGFDCDIAKRAIQEKCDTYLT